MTAHFDLEVALAEPDCPGCGHSRVRPVDITQNGKLLIRCRVCEWFGYANLPAITKTMIYLDTSTVSHIGRARARGEKDSPWLTLYERLQRAVSLDVVCCPGSSIFEDEAELSKHYKAIVEIPRTLAAPVMRHALEIEECQTFRALDGFLRGELAALETKPPASDAFYEDVHKWLPMYSVSTGRASPIEWIEARRATKVVQREMFEQIYLDYAKENASLEQMRAIEGRGYGKGVLRKGLSVIRQRAGAEPISAADPSAPLWATTLDLILGRIQKNKHCSLDEALAIATNFLSSDHYQATPHVDIAVKLHTALAMLCRGEQPRLPKASDGYDVNHIAIYMPYMDVFIADSFFATVCNQNNVRLGDTYSTDIVSLGEREIPAVIDRIDRMVEASPQAPLAKRITDAIHQGGFHQEWASAMSAYLREHGVDPDDRGR